MILGIFRPKKGILLFKKWCFDPKKDFSAKSAIFWTKNGHLWPVNGPVWEFVAVNMDFTWFLAFYDQKMFFLAKNAIFGREMAIYDLQMVQDDNL